jgi:hypothetical protein
MEVRVPAVDYPWAEPPQVVLVPQLLDYLVNWSSIRAKVCILSYEEGVRWSVLRDSL